MAPGRIGALETGLYAAGRAWAACANVKIGTVYLRPKESTPQRNLKLFCGQIDAAGKLGLDIVCLPEAITVVGTGYSGPQLAERIPGPSTDETGAAARRNRIWVVAGLYERDRDLVYNSAVLLNREGRLAGKYRKIHLPREEWEKGVTPGGEYPVFNTEFGTIAIQVCYDDFPGDGRDPPAPRSGDRLRPDLGHNVRRSGGPRGR